jgi:hypothetical protein
MEGFIIFTAVQVSGDQAFLLMHQENTELSVWRRINLLKMTAISDRFCG